MIQVEKLSYEFPDKELYKDVSFTLEDGQHCVFIGSNGTGKTTLVDMLMHPDNYLYDGKIMRDASCRIGYVSQFSKDDKNQGITVFEFLSEMFVKNQEETDEIIEQIKIIYNYLYDKYNAKPNIVYGGGILEKDINTLLEQEEINGIMIGKISSKVERIEKIIKGIK